MTCQKIKLLFPDYLIGDISAEDRLSVQSHLADCQGCRRELENLSEMWTKLGVLPEQLPSDSLRGRFYGMLDGYKRELEKKPTEPRWQKAFAAWMEKWWPRRPAFQFGFTLFALVAGITVGFLIRNGLPPANDLGSLRSEVRGLRLTMASSLLDNKAASERLKGIHISADLSDPGDELLGRLLQTLNGDDNINVRLAAVDALYLFRDHPMVVDGLAQSLTRQESPLVQVALIDLMVSVRERRAVDALRALLRNESLNPEVKQRAEQGLAELL
jgi:hypothetical protein